MSKKDEKLCTLLNSLTFCINYTKKGAGTAVSEQKSCVCSFRCRS